MEAAFSFYSVLRRPSKSQKKKLKAHKTAKTVKDPYAIDILEVRYLIFYVKEKLI